MSWQKTLIPLSDASVGGQLPNKRGNGGGELCVCYKSDDFLCLMKPGLLDREWSGISESWALAFWWGILKDRQWKSVGCSGLAASGCGECWDHLKIGRSCARHRNPSQGVVLAAGFLLIFLILVFLHSSRIKIFLLGSEYVYKLV